MLAGTLFALDRDTICFGSFRTTIPYNIQSTFRVKIVVPLRRQEEHLHSISETKECRNCPHVLTRLCHFPSHVSDFLRDEYEDVE